MSQVSFADAEYTGKSQEERNGPKVPGTHYHIQNGTVPGGTPGFAPGIQGYDP